MRGGKREGAGRKPGSNTDKTEVFYARVTPTEKVLLEKYLDQLRSEKNETI